MSSHMTTPFPKKYGTELFWSHNWRIIFRHSKIDILIRLFTVSAWILSSLISANAQVIRESPLSSTQQQAPQNGPGKNSSFKVDRLPNLVFTAEQEIIRQKTIKALEADLDGFVARYLLAALKDHNEKNVNPASITVKDVIQRTPLIISPDEARSLFNDYAKDIESHFLYSQSVHEASKSLVKEISRRALSIQNPRGDDLVVILAGGAASGKTTSLKSFPELGNTINKAQIIFDSTLADYREGQERISESLNAGKRVIILYIFTPIELAARWMVERALREGRRVGPIGIARSHWYSQETVLRLFSETRNDPRVSFNLIMRDEKTGTKIAPIEELKKHLYSNDKRFASFEEFINYAKKLILEEVARVKTSSQKSLLTPRMEEAFLNE